MKIASACASSCGVLALHLAQDPHAQARARERVAIDHGARQPEFHADPAHLVLEQLAQRLDQLQFHVLPAGRRRCGGS